jgi:addiction module HigA family antidote
MIKNKLNPVHPGEILQHEFIEPFGLNQNKLALAIHVPARRINEIILKKRSITADTALRLSRYFNNSPQFWLGLQMDYELDMAEDKMEEKILNEIKPRIAIC